MKHSDETLMAYADGELDAQTRREIEAAINEDPQVAQRVADHRALREELQAAFSGVLGERVPEQLLSAATLSPAAPKIADFAAAQSAVRAKQALPGWSWPQYVSLAASMLVGVMVGWTALNSQSSALFVTDSSGLLAGKTVANALSDQPGGTASRSGVQVGLTFRNRNGEYCRTFGATSASLTGVACRATGQWRVQVLAQGASATGDYRMASTSLPAPILKTIEDTIQGEPLDAAAEATARARDWQD